MSIAIHLPYRLACLAFGTVVDIYSAIGGDSVSARVEAFGSGAWGCVSEPTGVKMVRDSSIGNKPDREAIAT